MTNFVDKVQYKNYNGQDWLWPVDDVDCWDGMLHDIDNLSVYLKHVPHDRRIVAVQAGGNAGWVPSFLSKHFSFVYTFEPEPINFYCLTANCPTPNVIKIQAGLGEKHGNMFLNIPDSKNLGMLFTEESDRGAIPILKLDDFIFPRVDFLQLDVEGFELFALKGGYSTLKKFKPVLSLEITGHSQKYGYSPNDLIDYLKITHDYNLVEKTNMDYIFI